MFRQDVDLKLEDFVDGIFETEWDIPTEDENKITKRSSPENESLQTLKKHRVISENEGREFENERNVLNNVGCEKSRSELLCSSNTSVDLFLSDKEKNEIQDNKTSKEVSATPQRGMWKQKFPGPAGLLPTREQLQQASLTPSDGKQLRAEELVFLMWTDSMLESPQWLQMLTDFGLEDENVPLKEFTIAWLKKRATARQLRHQKVPFLATVVYTVDCSSPDPSIILRDRTGEIQGTLDREVWKQYGGHLVPGSVMLLHRASVLSLGLNRRRHYLNITANNILSIYSCGKNGQVKRTVVHSVSRPELEQSVSDWRIYKAIPEIVTPPNTMFTAVGKPSPLNPLKTSASSFTPPAFRVGTSSSHMRKSGETSVDITSQPLPVSSAMTPTHSGFKCKVPVFGRKLPSSPCGGMSSSLGNNSRESQPLPVDSAMSFTPPACRVGTSSHMRKSGETSVDITSQPLPVGSAMTPTHSGFKGKVSVFGRMHLSSPCEGVSSSLGNNSSELQPLPVDSPNTPSYSGFKCKAPVFERKQPSSLSGGVSSSLVNNSPESVPAVSSKPVQASDQNPPGINSGDQKNSKCQTAENGKGWGSSDLDVLEGLDSSFLFDDF